MEAIDFLKEYQRMCTGHENCNGCPLVGTACAGCCELSKKQMVDIVYKTEQWSKEHPVQTNAQKFKEVFGCEATNKNTRSFDYTVAVNKDWWNEPYKEPEHDR